MAGDPLSAFGSVLGLNRRVDAATAEVLSAPGLFVEAIVAPDFEPAALEILTTRPKWKANVRLMKVGQLDRAAPRWTYRCLEGRPAGAGGRRAGRPGRRSGRSSPTPSPTDAQMADLRFAWAMVRHVKSNAIVLAKDRMLLGAGAGQMSRVDSVEIAIKKAGDRAARLGAGLRRLLPLPRLDRAGRRRRRDRRHPARRLAQRRRVHRRLQPPRPAHDLHRPPALQALARRAEQRVRADRSRIGRMKDERLMASR